MKLLAIDTTTDYLSIALGGAEGIIIRTHRQIGRDHLRLLMPSIEKVLKKASVAPEALDGFCVSIGPGSFAGLRIGVTAIKALALSLKKPVVAVPTLDVIAYNALPEKGRVSVVLDARKDKVYACIYESDGLELRRKTGYLLTPLADLLKTTDLSKAFFIGDMVPRIPGLYQNRVVERWQPKAERVLALGTVLFRKGQFVKAEDLEPMYLYSKECATKGV